MMSKGILEQLNDNIVELISLIKAKPDVTIVKSDSVVKAIYDNLSYAEFRQEAISNIEENENVELPAEEPKKEEPKQEVTPEPEVKEEPKAEEPEVTISDDELTKAVKEVAKKDKAHLVEIKKYITEKSVSKVTELAQSDRQDFLDHLAGL